MINPYEFIIIPTSKEIVWFLCWASIIFYTFKRKTEVIPPVALGYTLPWEFFTLISLSTYQSIVIGPNLILYIQGSWFFLSLIILFLTYSFSWKNNSKKLKNYFIWTFIWTAFNFSIFRLHNGAVEHMMISGRVGYIVISAGFLYKLLSEKSIKNHFLPVFVFRFIALFFEIYVTYKVDKNFKIQLLSILALALFCDFIYIMKYLKFSQSPKRET